MAEVKAFRWKGPGVLHIKRPDGKLEVVPPYSPGEIEKGCNVRNPMNIEALGQERIASLIAAGQAEPIKWTDDIAAFLKNDPPPLDPETGVGSLAVSDVVSSEAELQKTHTFETFVQKANDEKAKEMSPTEKAQAEHELRKVGMSGQAKIAQPGPLAGGGSL
jgi:hypothetical protein